MKPTSKQAPGPKFVRFFGPVLAALQELGGSARPSEVCAAVAKNLKLSDEVTSELLPSGATRFNNQVAWARFYLGKVGILDTSRHGIWTLTEKGRAVESLSHSDALDLFRRVQAQFAAAPRAKEATERSSPEASTVEEESPAPDPAMPQYPNHRLEALRILRALPAKGFEQFCQALLRESDFQEVIVTGRSGDGGIDGIGLLRANKLVSFKVLFQCKKYAGSVTPGQVRDFRGAMMGRADKGIILTTGTFTSDAKLEAVRDGVPPIELVDGERLLDLMEGLSFGLTPVTVFAIDEPFFERFRPTPGDRDR